MRFLIIHETGTDYFGVYKRTLISFKDMLLIKVLNIDPTPKYRPIFVTRKGRAKVTSWDSVST